MTRTHRILFFLVLFFFTLSHMTGASGLKLDTDRLDAYIRKGIKDFSVPAAAVAVIADGRIIFKKTYGVRSTRNAEPVTANTLFALGSNTKSMSSVAFANLISQGKVNWDDKVKAHLPKLNLSDPDILAELTIRDLLGMRAGFVFDNLYHAGYIGQKNLDQLMELIPVMPVDKDRFRKKWFYMNQPFIIASKLLEEITGKPFDQAMEELVFTPLSMTSTYACYEKAMTHEEKIEKNRSINWGKSYDFDGYGNVDGYAAAGSAFSTLDDFIRYLKFHMNQGQLNGRQIISAEALLPAHQVQMKIPSAEAGGPTFQAWFPEGTSKVNGGYGLGLIIFEYFEEKIIWHGGQTTGGDSVIAWMPDKKVGFVALTNAFMTDFTESLLPMILNPFIGKEQEDKSKRFLNIQNHKDDGFIFQSPENKSPMALSPDKYTGIFESPSGIVSIRLSTAGKLEFKTDGIGLSGSLRHIDKNTFLMEYDDRSRARIWSYWQSPIEFKTGTDGKAIQFQFTSPFWYAKKLVTFKRK